MMLPIDWIALGVLLITGVVAGGAITSSNGRVTRAIRRMEQTYRREKSLELELLQAQVLSRRRLEVMSQLNQPDGWQKVLDQLLVDALPQTSVGVETTGVLEVSAAPVPRFTVAGGNGHDFLFTISPGTLRRFGLLHRKDQALPLDAVLHTAARVEVQAVWEYLASRRLTGEVPPLPRRAEWFLVVRERSQENAGRNGG